jgi:UDP-N-acetylglucosamine 2-epimerase (non-hydrolysing)
VIGTRPEALKLAPVANALRARGIQPRLILTGQHRKLDLGEFGLGGFPAVQLDCPGEEDPHAHPQKVTTAVRPLLQAPPDLLVVQGDTSSALGTAMAAFAAQVPVAHVEAGLRTHDPQSPWPEEEYRTAIDAEAELLFAPTERAAANLAAEGVPGEVHVTGNSGIDSLIAAEAQLPPPRLNDSRVPRLLVTCHRRDNWGAGLRNVAAALMELVRNGAAQADFVLHPNPFVAASMKQLLTAWPGITLIDPCSHRELLQRMRDADLVLSDSGGIQEEAPAIGTPLLVLRDKTERPEAVESGNALLVGTSSERIVAETKRLLGDPVVRAAMARRAFPFGDGRAGPRIAGIIGAWLECDTVPNCAAARNS